MDGKIHGWKMLQLAQYTINKTNPLTVVPLHTVVSIHIPLTVVPLHTAVSIHIPLLCVQYNILL